MYIIIYDNIVIESLNKDEQSYRNRFTRKQNRYFFPEITDDTVMSIADSHRDSASGKNVVSWDVDDIDSTTSLSDKKPSEHLTHRTYHEKDHISKSKQNHEHQKHNQIHKHKKLKNREVSNQIGLIEMFTKEERVTHNAIKLETFIL